MGLDARFIAQRVCFAAYFSSFILRVEPVPQKIVAIHWMVARIVQVMLTRPGFTFRPVGCTIGSWAYVSGSGTALRVGLLALRDVPSGTEVFAPYVALAQRVEERRQEMSSLFSGSFPSGQFLCLCPRCRLEVDGDRSCGRVMLKVRVGEGKEGVEN